MKKIRVFVLDDSPLFRRMLVEGLSKFDYIDIVGYAVDPIDAIPKIKSLKPDVITSDIEMPKMDGITFVKKMMAEDPIRIIVVSAVNISVFDAISAGAVDFVRKPVSGDSNAVNQFMQDIADKILIASQARLRTAPGAPVARANASNPDSVISKAASRPLVTPAVRTGGAPTVVKPLASVGGSSKVPFIAMGASTGGTEALLEVVKDLPEDTPGIVIVQHMPAGFTRMYADRLNKICRMSCREAKNGDKIERGLILVAPGDLQMSVEKKGGGYSVRCIPGERVSGHRPSVDVLFDSVAKTGSPGAIGVILTGMGADGAKGMLEMKNAGSYTIGQDEESCVVYGMPMMAFNMGGVVKQAPLDKIAGIIMSQLK